MGKILKRSLLALFITTVALGWGVAVAQAPNDAQQQSGNGFRISPVRSEYTIEKGKSETLTITIENTTDIPTTAVGVVETRKLPDQAVFEYLSSALKLPAEKITLLVAPAASQAGAKNGRHGSSGLRK